MISFGFLEPLSRLSIPDFVLFHTSAAGTFVVCARSQKTRNRARYSADTADTPAVSRLRQDWWHATTAYNSHKPHFIYIDQNCSTNSIQFLQLFQVHSHHSHILIVQASAGVSWLSCFLTLKQHLVTQKRSAVFESVDLAVLGGSVHGTDNSLEVLQEGQVSLVPVK